MSRGSWLPVTNVSKMAALGSSMCRILRCLEVPGSARCRKASYIRWFFASEPGVVGVGQSISRFHDVFEHILARNRCFPSVPVRFCIYFLALRFLVGSVSRWLAFVFFGSSVGWRVGCLAGRSTAACSDVAAGLVWRARHEKASYIRWFFASEPGVVGTGQRDLVVSRRV